MEVKQYEYTNIQKPNTITETKRKANLLITKHPTTRNIAISMKGRQKTVCWRQSIGSDVKHRESEKERM